MFSYVKWMRCAMHNPLRGWRPAYMSRGLMYALSSGVLRAVIYISR